VASELRFEARDALLLRAAPVDEGQLRKAWPERFVTEDVVRWDSERRALVALRETRFDRIVLDSRSAGRVDPQHAAQALTDAVAELGLQALPWTEGLRQWQARVESLRRWMPELGLPDCSDAPCWPTVRSGCSPRSPARAAWMRWTNPASARR
jgi:ATP-dependent helicase HrpB